jgi:hypothetical protein
MCKELERRAREEQAWLTSEWKTPIRKRQEEEKQKLQHLAVARKARNDGTQASGKTSFRKCLQRKPSSNKPTAVVTSGIIA